MAAKLCVPLTGPSVKELKRQWESANPHADFFELRLDCFPRKDWEAFQELRKNFSKPLLVTLRSKDQGGQFEGTVEERREILHASLNLKPDLMDLEWRHDLPHIQQFSNNIPIILSEHRLSGTPLALQPILAAMRGTPATFYKIVTHAHSSLDSLRVLNFLKEQGSRGDLIAHAMGEDGRVSRILAPLCGSGMVFSGLPGESSAASGMLDFEEILHLYRFRQMGPTTRVYALMGNPVSHSPGVRQHNAAFAQGKENAIYVNLRLQAHELGSALQEMKTLPFQGMSVTMPLKNKVVEFCKELSVDVQATGACNTVLRSYLGWKGMNTDGLGALDSLEEMGPIKGKRVLILGAGGAAAAIAREAQVRGAKVILVNRSEEKASALAQKLGCESASRCGLMQVFAKPVDVVVNGTSVGMAPQSSDSPLPPHFFQPGMLVMDVVSQPPMTKFLADARTRGCKVVTGIEFWEAQAKRQRFFWNLCQSDSQASLFPPLSQP